MTITPRIARWFEMNPGSSALPVKRAFFDGVNVSDKDDSQEREHSAEAEYQIRSDQFLKSNGPRVHEDHLDIEQDEEQGDQIELNAESSAALALREHSALVGDVLGLSPSP